MSLFRRWFFPLLILWYLPAVAVAGELKVLNVSEHSLDGHPAIAVIVSDRLSSRRRYDRYLLVTDGKGEAVRGAWVLGKDRRTLYFSHIEPERKYTVLVKRGLRAANGKRLAASREFTLKTRKIVPAFDFASRGSILIARLSSGLPIVTINVPEVDVEFFRIRDRYILSALRQFGYPGSDGQYSIYSLKRLGIAAESVYMARYRTMGKRNTRTVTHLPVHQIRQLRRPGLYAAVLRRAGHFNYSMRMTFFFVSDIGLHTRVYEDGITVHTSSLTNGRPLSDVVVTLYDSKGRVLGKRFTDDKGNTRFDTDPGKRALIIARRGRHLAVLPYRQPALDLSEFTVGGPAQHPLEAFAWSSRDLIRPGEKLDVSVLLRNQDGRMVKPIPLFVRLHRPDGREMARFTWQSQGLGYYGGQLDIPHDAQTGTWRLAIRTNPTAKKPVSVFSFKVEEFLPERMKLLLDSNQKALRPKQAWFIDVSATYLYGAPAAGNRLTAVLNLRPAHHLMPVRYKGFFFGDIRESDERVRKELFDGKLDSHGRQRLKVSAPAKRYHSPMAMRVVASVYETGGRPVTRAIGRILWPASHVVGVRPLYNGRSAPENGTVGFEVVRIDRQGRKVSGTLSLRLVREQRNYYWAWDASKGWHYAFSEAHYPVLRRNIDVAADKRTIVRVPVRLGPYRLELRDPDTGLVTSYRFTAGWGWHQRAQGANARPDRVRIRLDKPAYRAGDTIVATIVPPHAGQAMVFLEAGGQLWHRRLKISAKGRTIRIRLRPEWATRHDLYLSAVVLRPASKRRLITPNRAVGVVPVRLDRSRRQLKPVIEAPARMRPERDLDITVRLDDLKGQQAMVTVAAVDEGILNITGFSTPDPFSMFFAQRAYGVRLYDVYGQVIELMKGVRARLRYGGDAPMAAQRSRRAHARVKTVALFSGPVRFDSNGVARVRLHVPDHNGSLRIMAVAFTPDRFGSAERRITVVAPVIAEVAMPRFLSPGDRSVLTLDLHNRSGKRQRLRVRISARPPLRLDQTTHTVTLEDKGRTSLRVPLSAVEGFGVGRVTLNVQGQDIDITRHYELTVRPAWPGTQHIRYRTLRRGDRLTLDEEIMQGMMPSTVSVILTASPRPLLNVARMVRGLLGYPYGCLEQTTSRAFPLLYVNAARARELGLPPLSLAERSKRIARAIGRLRTMQLSSGGFSLWNGNGPEEMWLSPYVTDFLLEARRQGFSVPDDMLKKALFNLRYRLVRPDRYHLRQVYTRYPKHLLLAARAYAGYVLARLRRAPLGNLRVLYDNHAKDARSGLPLVHLGLALLLQGDEVRGMQAIRKGVAMQRDPKAYLGDYGSPVRDTGMIMALLARHRIDIQAADKLVYALSRRIRERDYLSTQEQLAVFLAAHAGKRDQMVWSGRLAIGGTERKITLAGILRRYLNAAMLRDGVRFTSVSRQPVYTSVLISGYTRQRPKPVSRELLVSRQLYDMRGKPVTNRSLKVGELFVVHLQVNARRRLDNVLVEDLLPAGLEIENLNLSRGEGIGNLRIAGVNPAEAMAQSWIRHREYRDDRFAAAIRVQPGRTVNLFYLVRAVTPGTYTVPPPFAGDMYTPAWHAIGESPRNMTVVPAGERPQ